MRIPPLQIKTLGFSPPAKLTQNLDKATTVKLNLGVFDGRFNSYFFVLNRQKEIIYHPRFLLSRSETKLVLMNIDKERMKKILPILMNT